MKPEHHLFIVWSKARAIEDRIIDDIGRQFNIVELFEVHWQNELFSNNLTRFYGQKLPDGSHKERHCGRGPFLLVIVEDKQPVYAERHTSKGIQRVNIKTFDAKSRYRKWTGGGHRIHATNDPTETRHDLALLFGTEAETYFHSQRRNQSLKIIHRDLVGASGWKNIEELFYVLNQSIEYVILRNFECLPHEYTMDLHGDIDLLVNNYAEAAFVTNATKVFKPKYRVHNRISIGGQGILFDFRYIGDGYYDQAWERDILRRRIFSQNGFYMPAPKDYFYSLLYHGAIHKREISNDYQERLIKLASQLRIQGIDYAFFKNPLAVNNFLRYHNLRNGYDFTEPLDMSVYFNSQILGKDRMRLQRRILLEISNFLRPLKHPKSSIRRLLIQVREFIMRLIFKTIG